jgi:hypothetical protein
VEARKSRGVLSWTVSGQAQIDELDRIVAVEAPDKPDFRRTDRTGAVIPDSQPA